MATAVESSSVTTPGYTSAFIPNLPYTPRRPPIRPYTENE